jgi:tetratricopeptide (TPR) repeat protein
MRIGTLLLALLLALGGVAHADDTAEAKRLYLSGTKHFNLAEYDAALNDFKDGYRHKDDPVFLYNIAQCYRLLNKNQEAITFYKSYLNNAPDAPNRSEVLNKISELEQAIAAQEKARTIPPQETIGPGEAPPASPPSASPVATTTPADAALSRQPAPAKTPVYKKWWLWTAVGAVVVVGVGIGLGVGLSQSNGASGSTFPAVTF